MNTGFGSYLTAMDLRTEGLYRSKNTSNVRIATLSLIAKSQQILK